MSTVQEIEQALQQLAPEDLVTFRAWFEKFVSHFFKIRPLLLRGFRKFWVWVICGKAVL